MRTQRVCEKNVFCDPIPPVVCNAATPTKVLSDVRKSPNTEFVGRFIQNASANVCYYTIGSNQPDAGVNNAQGVLFQGQQAEIISLQEVWVYAAAGCTILITQLRRVDNANHAVLI